MTSTPNTSQLSERDQLRRSYGLKLFQYLRSGTPLGSDNPAVLLAARSSVKANLHACEAWYLMSKVKEHYLKAQQALANDDSETAAKHLRKAKQIETQQNYEQKAADEIAATHLLNLKKAMNTAKNFERSQLASNAKHLEQKNKLWCEALQLERQKFSAHILCHAPPAAKNKTKIFNRQTLIHSVVMTGGAPI